MPDRPSAKVKATLTEVVPERRLYWHGNVAGDRVFVGTREIEIDPQPDGTVLFTHVEDVSGLLFPVFCALMGPAIQLHRDNLNAALKQRAEKQSGFVKVREGRGILVVTSAMGRAPTSTSRASAQTAAGVASIRRE